jgi:hypothetical protein
MMIRPSAIICAKRFRDALFRQSNRAGEAGDAGSNDGDTGPLGLFLHWNDLRATSARVIYIARKWSR